ncbi:MAG: 2-dehydro-3-deoxygalactonokinase [Alphaproteobacteria bacterium]|nr:2-dehydro-3-deoxygalactonokinase [Alphaproteobacteria bacterium]NNF24804.1 2-dehydro-3-deoxygalactonokinase [Paracoccaceae bacterium]
MSANSRYADWIAVDWGTSNCRAWAMSAAGEALATAQSGRGMGTLAPAEFEPALLEMIEPWLGAERMTVVACGMVGSRQGWTEAPYRTAPCAPLGRDPVRAPASDPRIEVHIVAGVKQTNPADVMRGEETQIAGFLHHTPDFDGVLCLPGTHTKWAQISAGEIVSFATFMTGEMLSSLSKHTVLRHSVGKGWDDDAFAEAVSAVISKPETLARRLFSLRAEGLLSGLGGAAARAGLSGSLIGAELAASRPYWLGQKIALIGAPALCDIYQRALALQGAPAEVADGADMTLSGLKAAYAQLKETAT